MEEGLTEINALPGVRGSFICDNQGDVIASIMPTSLDKTLLSSIGQAMIQTTTPLEIAGDAISELSFTYERVHLVARGLANAVLIILCERRVDMAMLRLTLNVVIARFNSSKEIMKQLDLIAADKKVALENLDGKLPSWASYALEVLGRNRGHTRI